jgi:hypothetical protein
MATLSHDPPQGRTHVGSRFEHKVIDTSRRIEQELNELGAQGWQVVGVTAKKQLLLAAPQAIILMRAVPPAG